MIEDSTKINFGSTNRPATFINQRQNKKNLKDGWFCSINLLGTPEKWRMMQRQRNWSRRDVGICTYSVWPWFLLFSSPISKFVYMDSPDQLLCRVELNFKRNKIIMEVYELVKPKNQGIKAGEYSSWAFYLSIKRMLKIVGNWKWRFSKSFE